MTHFSQCAPPPWLHDKGLGSQGLLSGGCWLKLGLAASHCIGVCGYAQYAYFLKLSERKLCMLGPGPLKTSVCLSFFFFEVLHIKLRNVCSWQALPTELNLQHLF